MELAMEKNYHLYYLITLLIKQLPWSQKQHLSSMTLKLKSHAVLPRSLWSCYWPARPVAYVAHSLLPRFKWL